MGRAPCAPRAPFPNASKEHKSPKTHKKEHCAPVGSTSGNPNHNVPSFLLTRYAPGGATNGAGAHPDVFNLGPVSIGTLAVYPECGMCVSTKNPVYAKARLN